MRTKLLFVFAIFAIQFSFAHFDYRPAVTDPTAISVSPLTYCDFNNDGFGTFDLTVLDSQILAAQSGSSINYSVTYHQTFLDADMGGSAIASPYYNITPWNETVYYRIRNVNTNAYAVGSFQLVVNSSPEATIPNAYHLCDVDAVVGSESFDLTTVVPEVLGSINPTSVSVKFYSNQNNAQNGLNPINTSTNYVNSVLWNQIIYIRVEFISTGCYHVVPLELVVDPLPQSMQPNYPQYALCNSTGVLGYETFDLSSKVSSIVLGQTNVNVTFFPSLGDAQNGTNQISNEASFVNTVIYVQTLGIRITNVASGCYVISSMDIRVSPLPNLVPPLAPYAVCDANQDGTAVFDLTTLIPDLVQGNANAYTVTFHETQTDAEVGGLSIPDPSSYTNILPFSQAIYVRGTDTYTGCYTILPVELVVNPAPIVGTLPAIQVCDADSNPQDAISAIDLTQQTAAILAQQSLPASNYIVLFYTSQATAFAGSSPIVPATHFTGTNGQTIWYRVETNSTGCYAIGSFQLVVNTPLLLTTPTPLSVCDNNANPNDQYITFDLTVKDNEITQGVTGYTVTYYQSLSDAYMGTSPIATPSSYVNIQPSVQTLGVRVTSPQGCDSFTTLDIRALPIPTPNTNPPALAPQCDVNNPGDLMEIFDLTVNSGYIINGDPSLTLHYYPTLSDATLKTNEFLAPAAALVGGNIWIRVENNRVDFTGNHCYVLVEQPLRVDALPNPEIISNNTLNTVYVDINNIVVQPLTLDAQLSGNYSFQWEVDGAPIPNANNSTYEVNTAVLNGASRVFKVTVQDLNTGCSSTSSIIVLQSNGVPPPTGSISQTLAAGSTLANIVISGTTIQWYASSVNKMDTFTNSTPLPMNTLLVDGTTYYATQTINGIESISRLPVTIHLTLGIDDNEILPIQYAPNPVKNSLTLQSTRVLKSVVVYTMLGQKILEQNCNDSNVIIDLSRVSSGNYILKAEAESGQKTIRIIKE